MNVQDIANIRLRSQQISSTKFKTAKEMVGWMGAMQAQDYNMARWALGIRLPGMTDRKLQTAIDNGEILRTHVLRPTWHFVSKEDIRWMIKLTAGRIMSAMKSRNRQLELTEKIFKKTNTILQKELADGNHSTRDELVAKFARANIVTDENRASHIFTWAELEGLICSGASKGKKQTYALLEERAPQTNEITKEEALAKLARVYFSSHCPATLEDFTWWSGLSTTDARNGLESVKSELVQETAGSHKVWLTSSVTRTKVRKGAVFLLPAYDEFIISYKDRTASLVAENLKKAVSVNGIFRPVIVIDGKVTGLWKRTIQNEQLRIETEFFHPHSATEKEQVEQAADKFGRFVNKKVTVSHTR